MNARRVVVVAQAFKETFSARVVAQRLAAGVEAAGGSVQTMLGSDGGDGLLEAVGADVVRRQQLMVSDPLGRQVTVEAGWLDDWTAVVESRLACGLTLLRPHERDPLRTSTRGVGQLISDLIAAGAREVAVGLGGSATMDGGVGMAREWGWVPRDRYGRTLPEGGGALLLLDRLEAGKRPGARLLGLCDVQNPLLGAAGARVYAAQKGATREAEERLARGLDQLVAVTASEGGAELATVPGAGAAGGLGFGLLFFGAARLTGGAPWVLDRAGFDQLLSDADVVMTGEGAFDGTSLQGKLTGEVMRRAGRAGVPVVLVSPSARDVPDGVIVESGKRPWNELELEQRAHRGAQRAFRLLGT